MENFEPGFVIAYLNVYNSILKGPVLCTRLPTVFSQNITKSSYCLFSQINGDDRQNLVRNVPVPADL